MRRRKFIALFGGVATWSLAARAQQSEHVRLIGIIGLGPDDPEGKARATVFEQTLQQFGWKVGRDLKIETRSAWPHPGDRQVESRGCDLQSGTLHI